MSLHEEITARIDELERIAKAATPGPWEAGHVWLRAGVMSAGHRFIPAGKCAYCHLGEPVLVEPDANINGTRMVAHTHRSPDPYDPEHSISGAAPDDVLAGFNGDYYSENISVADALAVRTFADPSTVLRGLAEDRDILARHRSDTDLVSQREFWECVACSQEIECNSDRYRDHDITVLWPCVEIRSLARRHGIEVPS